jgi:hypothetical protein
MRIAFHAVLMAGAWSLAVGAAPAPEQKDYQKVADTEEWQWKPESATATGSAKSFRGDFQADVAVNDSGATIVKFAKGDEIVFTLEGHAWTVFAGRGNVVYYADFIPQSSGCSVIAYDLKAKKQVWKTNLKGLGPIDHTKYRNAVILDIKDDAVHILGNESAGKYVEYLDLKSGKTVGHRVFDKNQKN